MATSGDHGEYVAGLIEEVSAAAKLLAKDVFSNNNARKRLQLATQRLSGALDNPIDGVRKIIFQVPYTA